jgi:hypothetical protein
MVLVVHHRLGLRNDRILDDVFYEANSAAVVSPSRFDDFLALVLVVLSHLGYVVISMSFLLLLLAVELLVSQTSLDFC